MKVSIVTPSFNQGQFIERTLQSVAIQDGAEIEHVVFDGGSTDSTVDVLTRFDPKVRWVSKKDRGQTDAVNQGIRATDGDIIGWLNSDDVYYPGTVSAVVRYFADHPDVDVVYGLADHIDLDDHAFEDYPTEAWDFERLKQTCFICQPAAFFRRRVVEQHGLLDESLNYCMDYAYWLRLGKAGVRFAKIDQKFAGSRLYADNKTLGARVKVHAEINSMFRDMFGKVPNRWIINYAHAVVEQGSSTTRRGRLFALKIGMRTLLASLAWNRGIPFEMIQTIWRWTVRA
jgi:glycosyltransferase involved in cell wall biosynthesis